MALNGTDIDSEALRSGGVVTYLNSYQKTRAWVGSDELYYAPGEVMRGTAYLKNNPHHARRQLVLSQVDVYLSPECVRRKVNNMYRKRDIDAKSQNLNEIYYTRRGGPGHTSYKSYYNYGETIPPRESPFRGPYQAQYHYKGTRFAGKASNVSLHEDFHDEVDNSSVVSSNFSGQVSTTQLPKKESSSIVAPETISVTDPGPIRCCVFKASRDGGPRPLPSTPYEVPFRFSLRIPDDAPENYAWAENKPGCFIEIRYRLYVVFKLRAQPRDAAHADDPLYWEGAVRNGESPLIVLFSESCVGVDPRPNSPPRNDVYTKHASPIGVPSNSRRKPKPSRRSILGRRSLVVHSSDVLQIGEELKLNVLIKCPVSTKKNERAPQTGEIQVELIEKALLKQGRKTAIHKSIRPVTANCCLNENGEGTIVVFVNTDGENLYPSARIGTLVVRHELKVTLSPGDRFSLTTRMPLTLVGGFGRFLTRTDADPMLYPPASRLPPWRKTNSNKQEREKLKRKEISERINQLVVSERRIGNFKPTEENEECVICLDDATSKKAVVLPCSHKMHADCAKDWMFRREECPICKEPFLYNS